MKRSVRLGTAAAVIGIAVAATTGVAAAQPTHSPAEPTSDARGPAWAAAHGVTASEVKRATSIHLPATATQHARLRLNPGITSKLGSTSNSTSGNWSGYAAYGTTFTAVYGSWVVPRVNCGILGTGASSTWIGIDGYGTSTVEQLGIRQNCLWGVASYYPWFEVYPQSEVSLPSGHPVSPGDVMWAETVHTSGNNYLFVMGDQTRSWTWSQTVAAAGSPMNASAEWVTEQPSCVYECSWLANFGTQSFLSAEALRSGDSWGPISAYWNDPITMQSGSTVKAVPSALSNSTYSSSFTDRFVHS